VFEESLVDEPVILMSIRPQYFEAIRNGTKKYEFRRQIFRQRVNYVYIYVSSPVKRVMGKFRLGEILKDSPSAIWEVCHRYGGISKEEFFRYFNGCSVAYAIEINDFTLINPLDLEEMGIHPPQSFSYLTISQINQITPCDCPLG
jgi:predicted transcriptional regulator